jgi:hypothetical protein
MEMLLIWAKEISQEFGDFNKVSKIKDTRSSDSNRSDSMGSFNIFFA